MTIALRENVSFKVLVVICVYVTGKFHKTGTYGLSKISVAYKFVFNKALKASILSTHHPTKVIED